MKKIGYIAIILIVLLGGVYLFRESKIKNVFDEMYYAQFQSFPRLYTSTSYSKLIKANILENLQQTVRNFYPDLKLEYYRDEILNKYEGITLVFIQEENGERVFELIGIKENETHEALRFYFIYKVETKELKIVKPDIVLSEDSDTDNGINGSNEIAEFMEKNDLVEEDLADYQNYFLYEKVLSDWFAHNPKSRFSLDDLGDVEIVEADAYEE